MKGEAIPRYSNSDIFLDISSEQFKSHQIINALGNNSSLPANETTIWEEDTIYVFPSAASIFTVESTDANDTIAGSGAQKVLLDLLDIDHVEFTEVVEMNGATPVAISKPAIRCNRVTAIPADETIDNTDRSNEGIIRVREANNNVLAHMMVGENRSDGTFFSVPRGKIAIFYFPSATVSAGTEAEMIIKFRNSPKGMFVKRMVFSVFVGNVITEINKPVTNLNELSDIMVNVDRLSGASPSITAGFQMVLIKKA